MSKSPGERLLSSCNCTVKEIVEPEAGSRRGISDQAEALERLRLKPWQQLSAAIWRGGVGKKRGAVKCYPKLSAARKGKQPSLDLSLMGQSASATEQNHCLGR
jgi:hypothetical protein